MRCPPPDYDLRTDGSCSMKLPDDADPTWPSDSDSRKMSNERAAKLTEEESSLARTPCDDIRSHTPSLPQVALSDLEVPKPFNEPILVRDSPVSATSESIVR